MKILLALLLAVSLAGVASEKDRSVNPTSVSLEAPGGLLRMKISQTAQTYEESYDIKDGGSWVRALVASGTPTRILTDGDASEVAACKVQNIGKIQGPDGILIRSQCSVGELERRITLNSASDTFDVAVRLVPGADVVLRSVEDRFTFAPGRRDSQSSVSGPVDFVWSQNLKSEIADLIPQWSFKSPAVMLQQGHVFTALMPNLGKRPLPLAIDLNVTSDAKPWFSYGAALSTPHGHSYFRRSGGNLISSYGSAIEYSYSVVASAQPMRLGYRSVVRKLWANYGREQLLEWPDLQQNFVKPELELFDEWRQEAWVRYADQVYSDADCPGGGCGTLVSNRNYLGQWDKPEKDAWFNAWFQTLRTAYGWYLYGEHTHNETIKRKAEGILNLALSSPQQQGAFSTIYLVPEKRWIHEDGWAGFPDHYHTFDMSWTAYWMLRWADDLVPSRKAEILKFTRAYGDFLVRSQSPSGIIPSWYDSDLHPKEEFRDFNAETGGSALFLLQLAEMTGSPAYLNAAKRALGFMDSDVIPRQRWFDYETFLSCARKDFSFYDSFTAQYPQNNLSTMFAAMAYLKLYQISNDPAALETGTRVLDYLLLTQQVWSNPALSPKLLGGTTTQNTDAEWSDARQGYVAVLLWDYYQATKSPEYLERAVAAARSTFAVAPWENWAHNGFNNEHGSLTGFHWGTGSAMTSVEIMAPTLGDVFIDVQHKHGVGFNATSLRNLRVNGRDISFDLEAVPKMQKATVRFAGIERNGRYKMSWNHRLPVTVDAKTLSDAGYVIELGTKNAAP
jgi:hypothetical protein